MSKKRFDNLDAKKQERLFDSAAEEFAEHGYDAASLNKILERSGMSKSSLYYYFEDKADLFVSLTERSMVFLLNEVGGFNPESLTAATYWSALEERISKSLEIFNRNTWYVKLGRMMYRLRGQPKGLDKTSRLFEGARNYVASILLRGQELGVVRTDLPQSLMVDMTMAIGEAVDRWMIEHWDEMDAAKKQEMISLNFALFRRLLEPD